MIPAVPHNKVRLVDENVAGAKLPQNPSVKDLKLFLKCHGYRTSGMKKKDLLVCASKITTNNVALSPSKDKSCGESLAKKSKILRARDLNSLKDPPDVYPVLGWKDFPSRPTPPRFNLLVIQQYLIESAIVVDSESEEESFRDFGTAKPLLKGRIFYQSGHVLSLHDALTNSEKFFCLKGKVRSSMGKNLNATVYNVLVMIDVSLGMVCDASCECKASELQRCSHIGAVLFAVEDYTSRNGFFPIAPTSKTCVWNKGGNNRVPVPVYAEKYSNMREPTRVLKTETAGTKNVKEKNEQLLNLVMNRSLFPNETKWESSLTFSYEDYVVEECRLHVLRFLRGQLKQSLKFGLRAPGMVPDTIAQSQSENWVNIRRLLVTASVIPNFINVLRTHE